MGSVQLAELERSGFYLSVPKGNSMLPMLRNGLDTVKIEKIKARPKRYDLVLYIRGEEQGVIHRVLREKDGGFIIAGDNCWQKEFVTADCIKGIVTEFCRGKKWHSTEEFFHRIYVHLWTDLFFIRRPIFYLRDRAKRLIHRIRTRRG